MAVYKRPGVYVQEQLLQTSPASFPSASAAAFVGNAYRGPTTPTLVTSWARFLLLYGGFSGTDQSLAHSVYQYFNNGGANAWVVRAVGTSGVTATKTINDRVGTPAPLLVVNAQNYGAWANNLYVEVTDVSSTDTSVTGRFNLVIRLGGSTDQYIVERWTDLSMNPADGRYAPNMINSSVSGSLYITITDLQPTGTYTAATKVPALTSPTALLSGADGTAPTLTGGVASQVYLAATLLASVDGFITINCPNLVDSATVNALIAFVEAGAQSFLVIDPAPAQTVAQIITTAAAYTSSSYAALYYPQINVNDPSNNVPGSTKLIPPGGAILGQYAFVDATRGTFKAPAGVTCDLNGVISLEYKALDSELDSLNVGKVNALKVVPGFGFCIFGARTLKINQVDRYISVRRTLVSLRLALIFSTRFAAFEPNDSVLWSSLSDTCSRILLSLWQTGGLAGSTASQAFYVKCDAELNPPNSVNNGEVHIEIGVALQVPAEFIVINIGQFESGSTSSEVFF